jgi:hypothetical protein
LTGVTAAVIAAVLLLQIYSQLAKVLGKVFFPTGNAAVQAVSFWGLFAGGRAFQAAAA